MRVMRRVKRNFSTTPETELGGMSREMFFFVTEKFCPFVKEVFGPSIEHAKVGELTMKLPFKKILIGNPVNRCYHGGVVATMLDHVGGFCAWTSLMDPHQRISTVDLQIDYLTPAPLETLYFDAVISHRSKTLIRSDIVCWNSDRSKKIASGRGLFNIYTAPHDITVMQKSLEKLVSQK